MGDVVRRRIAWGARAALDGGELDDYGRRRRLLDHDRGAGADVEPVHVAGAAQLHQRPGEPGRAGKTGMGGGGGFAIRLDKHFKGYSTSCDTFKTIGPITKAENFEVFDLEVFCFVSQAIV